MLSHHEQYARLAETVPQALAAAVVAGDPCLDRMLVSEPRRRRYRDALGANDGTRVILVTSTWGPDSLLGKHPDLIAQLLAELPSDQHVVAAVLHPNTWFAHGPAQVRLWLGDCLRAGLRLIPPARGWQQTVLAADVVIGDFGAVTAYSACLGRPTLLASFPDDQVAPGSAVAAVGRTARRLDPAAPFAAQFDAATTDFAEVRELATSLPGQSATTLRKLFYDIMAFPEPARTPLVPAYSPAALTPERVPVAAWWATADWHSEREVRVTRWPADVDARPEQPPDVVDRHLVVDRCHSRRDLYTNAAIVLLEHASEAAAVFAERPACMLVVAANQIRHRDGTTISTNQSNVDDMAAVASARYGQELPDQFTVLLGSRQLHVTAR